MRRLLPLALIFVILTSGCINFGASKSMFGIFEVKDNPNLYMKVDASTSEIKAGRDVKLQFTVNNPGTEPLRNYKLTAYDQCLFAGTSSQTYAELKPNATKIWTWTWTAKDTEFPVDCEIKFRAEYDTSATFSKTVTVLQKTEFYSREAEGTLNKMQISSFATDSPLKVDITFSEAQPFLEGEDVYMYIDSYYDGSGNIQKISKGDINMTSLSNADLICSQFSPCSAYATLTACEAGKCDWSGTACSGGLRLNKDLTFVSKKTPEMTCKLATKAEQPIHSSDMRLTVKYKYQFDDSLLLKVNPK